MNTLKILGYCTLLLPFSLFSNLSNDDAKYRMFNDLDAIKGVFITQYAPAQWKESYIGWSLEKEIEFAKMSIEATDLITVKNYQRIVRDFFKSMHDYHVNVFFYSTESASLPFLIKSANHHYFITALNRRLQPSEPLKVGDEIVTFNGVPIEEAVKTFQLEEFGHLEDSPTDRAFAEIFFTKRLGAYGHIVPKGDVILGIKHKGTDKIVAYSMTWQYKAEEIKNIPIAKSFAVNYLFQKRERSEKTPKTPLNQNSFFKKSMLSPYYATLKEDSQFTAGEGLGDKESFVPPLGKKIWASHPKSPFHAYLFETADMHRYGYIRIPHYDASSHEAEEFKLLVAQLEAESEALIIDQLNNPGGSVFYMYALASVLTEKPLKVPYHRISITPKEVAFAVEALASFASVENDEEAMELIGEDLDGLPITTSAANQIADYLRFILSQWNLGISFTSPYPLWGFHDVMPDPEVRYTKPILMLINHLDLSCGDFFPSILRDNNRVTLLGTKTAGAGGFVLNAEYPNMFGIEHFSYTGSIAYRADETPLENLGVIPDIEYSISELDLTTQYQPFKRKILESIKNLSQ